MSKSIPLEIGQEVTFSKTVGETDVYLFAGITGDFSPNHVNEHHMSKTPYKKRIAHGALFVGFMSTASVLMYQKTNMDAVSYGYDRLRFMKPVFIGDTITVHYKIAEVDQEGLKTKSAMELYNQDDELCAVGTHILKFFN